MSDNEDLLGDDLGDQSLADYNLGNEEEEQLLADDYDNAVPQNVPYREIDMVLPENSYNRGIEYSNTILPYEPPPETESVVPNVNVDVPDATMPQHTTYAPYEPPYEEHTVPPTMPAVPQESPQIVPSDINAPVPNIPIDGDLGGPRERFVSERPPGAQRLPQVRDIPDSLDKVVIPRGGARGRSVWRSAEFAARFPPHYRRYPHRGNFNQRSPYPPSQQLRSINNRPPRPESRPEMRPEMRPELRPEPHPEMRPDIRPNMRQEPSNIPQMGPEISPERPILPQELPMYRPNHPERPFYPRFQFRPNMEERPPFNQGRPNFEPRPPPVFFRPNFPPRQYAPPMREIVPNSTHMPQVTIRQALPGPSLDKPKDLPREPEVRMLPVALPPNLPPGGLAGKKVLINPHFKGNFQPPVEGLPVYIPTRIPKSPPLSPTIESKFGPVKDIDDAAERFIAEQRNALARAAIRKHARRSPQRYIENTTIEIENDLAHAHRPRSDDDDLLRRQEEFINANRAGLRRRMRSCSPARRSPSPRRSPERRARHADEDTDYKRKMREQENLRERVLRAKEVRRRKNAVAMHKQLQEKERDTADKDKPAPPPAPATPPAPPARAPEPPRSDAPAAAAPAPAAAAAAPAAAAATPAAAASAAVVENLTPPHNIAPKRESTERALTPPLPDKRTDSDDDLDLILGDIDGILSDDEDTGRFKDKTKDSKKSEPPKSKPAVDLRSKLPPKPAEHKKPQRQKIVFEEKEEGKSKKKEKSPTRRAVVTSSTKTDENEPVTKKAKVKPKLDLTIKSRARITYDNKEQVEKDKDDDKTAFSNRRVILQRKAPKDKSVFSRIEVKTDPSKPNPGIFSRAVRTAIGTENTRIVINKKDEPQVQFESDSDLDEDTLLEDSGNTASVANLPHGMTDTRLKTLAGNEVQSLTLDKEDRTAKIIFKTTAAAESFKKKFNNKMVAASRLSVTLR